MGELIQSVKNGAIENTKDTSATKKTTGTSSLGKDEFLQLLVAQMKYQDPLNPSTDTQYVSQLATFSQLEQMQNLNLTSTNSQAFGLVGKDVIVKTEDALDGTSYNSGTVDFITMSGGKAQLSIDGNLYSLDQLYQVIDSTYLIKQGLPTVETTNATYDKSNPTDISFKVDLGKNLTVATEVAVAINNKVIDSKYVTLSNNKVTISKDALSGLETGSYKATVGFNDSLQTTVSDKVTIIVKDSSL